MYRENPFLIFLLGRICFAIYAIYLIVWGACDRKALWLAASEWHPHYRHTPPTPLRWSKHVILWNSHEFIFFAFYKFVMWVFIAEHRYWCFGFLSFVWFEFNFVVIFSNEISPIRPTYSIIPKKYVSITEDDMHYDLPSKVWHDRIFICTIAVQVHTTTINNETY